MMSVTSFWVFLVVVNFERNCFNVSIIDFEQVNTSWEGDFEQLLTKEVDFLRSIILNELLFGIIHVVRTRNFLKNLHFLPPDTQT